MQLAAFVVLFPTLVAKICFGALVIKSYDPHQSKLVEASIDILESCYIDRFGTVGLVGPSAGSIVRRISLRNSVIPVVLIDGTAGITSHHPVDRASRHKLQVFVVTLTDPKTLVDTLMQVKHSKWWNHMASFLFVPEIDSGCSNAYEVLWEAWKMNLLNSKFMCFDRTRGKLIYTFNPYTSEAPFPWQQEDTYKGLSGHVWTLFVQEYREDKTRCNGLDFDKTSDLGGYEIRATVRGIENWWNVNPTVKPTLFNRRNNITAQILMSSLNATWNMALHSDDGRTLQDRKGNPTDAAAKVIGGNSDICLNLAIQQLWTKYETTYPHCPARISVITQYRGYKSQLDKIITVLDRSSRFCVLAVLLITLLFFKFCVGKPLIPAIMNIVLIVCNAALPKIPGRLSLRLYLCSLLIFVVTIHGIYQGQFATLLTRPVRLSSVDSIDDLARSDHTIYGLGVWRSFLNQSAFWGRYVGVLEFNCTGFVLRDSESACVGESHRLMHDAANLKLHVSRDSVGTFNFLYLIRPDWPLEERVNMVHGRVAASGIENFLYDRELNSRINELQSYENQYQDQQFKVITLGQLGFAFVILGIGLGCAAVSFIIEVAAFDTAITRPRRRNRRRIRLVK